MLFSSTALTSICEVVKADLKEQKVFAILLPDWKIGNESITRYFDEDTMIRIQVFDWFGHFKRGEMRWEDYVHSGHPWTSRNDGNVKITLQKWTKDQSFDDWRNFRRRNCKWIHLILNEFKNLIKSDKIFLIIAIAGDKSLCYSYHPETKQASGKPQIIDTKKKARWV